MRAERRLAAFSLLALVSSGCVQLEQPRADAERAVSRAVGERLSLPFPPSWGEASSPELSTEGASLLAGGLDEEVAVRVALLENRTVRASFEHLGVASYERVRAGLLSNPIFSAALLFHGSGTELDLGLSQPLVDLFRRSLRQEVAEAHLEVASTRVLEDLIDVAFDARVAVLAQRAQDERVRLTRAAFVVASEAEALTRELHGAGNVTDLELSRRSRDRAVARLELLAAEAEAVERREDLVTRLGLPPGTDFELLDQGALEVLPAPPPDNAEQRAIEQSLELVRLDARVRAAAARANVGRSAHVFDEARAGVGAGDNEFTDGWGVGPLLSVPIPLFDTGTAEEAVHHAALRAALAERERAARALASSASRLAARHASLADRAHVARAELVPLGAQVMVRTLQQYNAMQIGAFDVLRERSAEVELELWALDLWEEAWTARLDLERLMLGAAPPVRDTPGARMHPSARGDQGNEG